MVTLTDLMTAERVMNHLCEGVSDAHSDELAPAFEAIMRAIVYTPAHSVSEARAKIAWLTSDDGEPICYREGLELVLTDLDRLAA